MADYSWFDIKHPHYEKIFNDRSNRIRQMRGNPDIVEGLKEHYRDNPIDFINDWGMTYDPRNAEIGLSPEIPFIMFPRQAEFVQWVLDRWKKREPGLTEKSRDMGISWLCVAIAVWMWLFYDDTVIGFGSRKEEYVDKLGDPKSLFWKIRKFIELLPDEFKPDGYNERAHALHMRIINPENGSVIVGESGDNIGRGNRTSIYFKDESAFYDHQETIDRALSQTTNCKLDLSTPNGNGNLFFRKAHSGKIPKFTFHWRDDPRKDEAWYEKQKAESDDPVLVAQELDIDYNASTEDAYINGSLVSDAQSIGPADIDPVGPWIIGVDAAHMGNDESVIHMRQGRLNLEQVIRRQLDGPALADQVEAECRDLMDARGIIGAIFVELDGPGVSCYDHLRKKPALKDLVQGIHTGTRLSDDRNYNIRAKLWRSAKKYLAGGAVCMPKDIELKSQISSMKYRYDGGLLLMQDKKEYKKSFGRSPDRADAFVLTFADFKEGGVNYKSLYGNKRKRR